MPGEKTARTKVPAFPEFKPIGLEDRDILRDILWRYQPQTSELTFTNLFIWRQAYRWQWALEGETLVFLAAPEGGEPYFLLPVRRAPRLLVVLKILRWLREERGVAVPRIERVDSRLASEVEGTEGLEVTPAREHFDYVYRSADLIALRGARYHGKRNFLMRFLRAGGHEFSPLDKSNLGLCAEFQERWCEWKRCEEDMNLLGEWAAVKEALANYESLGLTGSAILIEGRVESFTFGEPLNADTAVVHIEKANPQIPGLYAAINQLHLEKYWAGMKYINREQDLGEEGLRRAKLSYHPALLVEKYRLRLTS